MNALLGAAAGMALLGGLALIVAGIRKSPMRADADGPTRPPRWSARSTTKTRRQLGIGIGVGVLLWLITGYAIAILVVPLAAFILPTLIAAPPGSETIARLEGMQAWTRSLTGVLDVGVGLEEAIVSASLRATPPAIATEVGTLVARIRARSDLPTVLRAFADDLDDATGDVIVATLLAGATRRGAGLVTVLESLADTVADEVRIRRTVEAERAPGRAAARWITLISIGFLTVLFAATDYTNVYKTPLGQLLLLAYLVAYLMLLRWMQSMAKSPPLPRFIGDHLRTRPRRQTGATR